MKKLVSIRVAANSNENKKKFAGDLAMAVDECIESLTGIKGVFIKKTYGVIKNVRPGYVEHVLYVMSDDLINAFEPLHDEYRKTQPEKADSFEPFEAYLRKNKEKAYDAFVSVADKYAETRKKHVVGKAYGLLRPQLKSNFDLAFPYVSKVMEKYTIVEAD